MRFILRVGQTKAGCGPGQSALNRTKSNSVAVTWAAKKKIAQYHEEEM
jgi:hypothetical protein